MKKIKDNISKLSLVRQILLGLGYSFLFIILLSGVKFFQIRKAMAEGAKMGPPPQSVTTSIVKKEIWNSVVESFAKVEPVNGALVKSEASGRVVKIYFSDGSQVNKNDLLLELDSSIEGAEYNSALAKAELAKKSFERQSQLFKLNAISQEEFDTAKLNYQSLDASAKALKSQLDRKMIKAPFNGKIGVRRVNIGQYVNIGDPLYQLQDDSDNYLSFSLGDKDSSKISVNNKVIFQPSNSNQVFEGKILAIDPSFSQDTGTRMAKVKLESSQNLLIGSFGKVVITSNDSLEAFKIPETGIQHAPYGDTIFIVKEEISEGITTFIAQPKFIKIIDRKGDFVAIKDGLQDGDQVVTSGTFKLQKGTKLIINNSLPDNSSTSPNPKNS